MKKRSKKKNVTEFSCHTPGFAEMFPILKAEKHRRDWLDECGKDIIKYNEEIKTCPISKLKETSFTKGRSIARCPGLRGFMRMGYLIPSPCDVTIETYGDGVKFEASALSPNINNMFKVTSQSGPDLNKYTSLPSNSLKSVVKIATSWNVMPSEEFVYLIMNPFYNNEPRFTVLPGLLDPYLDTQLNIFLAWNVLQGRETLKAGSILAQLIPLPRDLATPDLECRTATLKDREKFMIAANTVSLTEIRDLSKTAQVMRNVFNDK